jgi:hypothetical protein
MDRTGNFVTVKKVDGECAIFHSVVGIDWIETASVVML